MRSSHGRRCVSQLSRSSARSRSTTLPREAVEALGREQGGIDAEAAREVDRPDAEPGAVDRILDVVVRVMCELAQQAHGSPALLPLLEVRRRHAPVPALQLAERTLDPQRERPRAALDPALDGGGNEPQAEQLVELVGRDVVFPRVAEVELEPAVGHPRQAHHPLVDGLVRGASGALAVGQRQLVGARDAVADRLAGDNDGLAQEGLGLDTLERCDGGKRRRIGDRLRQQRAGQDQRRGGCQEPGPKNEPGAHPTPPYEDPYEPGRPRVHGVVAASGPRDT